MQQPTTPTASSAAQLKRRLASAAQLKQRLEQTHTQVTTRLTKIRSLHLSRLPGHLWQYSYPSLLRTPDFQASTENAKQFKTWKVRHLDSAIVVCGKLVDILISIKESWPLGELIQTPAGPIVQCITLIAEDQCIQVCCH